MVQLQTPQRSLRHFDLSDIFTLLLVVFTAAFVFMLAGCSTGGGSSPEPTRTITSVAVSPGSATVGVTATQQLTATATYSDGTTANVSSTATWTATSPAIATVNAAGLVTGVGPGSASVSASLSSVNGAATITVPQPTKTLSSIAVTPATATLAVGATQQLTATGTFSDGSTSDLSAQVAWTTSNAALGSVSSTGLVTAAAAGSVNITATLNGISGESQITVPQPAITLTAIAVAPAAASVAIGSTQQLTATATYSDNSTASVTTQVTWISSNPALASVNASGVVTGVAAGAVNMTASLNGVSGASQITIPQPAKTLTSIAVTPAAANVTVGSTQQLTATATYSDNSTAVVTPQVTWISSNPAFASVNASGVVTGVAAGGVNITATLNGVSGASQITVPQPAKILTSIAVTPGNASITAGATQQFAATATYSDNSTANVSTTVGWASSNQSYATINASGLATGVAAGSATITATLNSVTGSTALTINPKIITAIAISPNPASTALGSTQQLTATATYQDSSTGDVTSFVSWTASNAAVVSVNSTGLATPVAAGSATISASLNGISGTVAFTSTIAPNTGVNILTWQNDVSHSGLNAGELSLSPANVSAKTFGKLFSYPLDGYEYGEPLLMSNLTINHAVHNVVFAATEKDSVFAFDADTYGSGAPLWQVSLLNAGETPLTNGPIQPYEGITSTPVIDPTTNTIYVVSTQITAGGATSFRLNALDITTGEQKPGSPMTIQASVPGTNQDSVNGTVTLTTACIQRSALLLENGAIYMGFSGCHSGWLLAYDANTLAQIAKFNASPNFNGEGPYASAGGIWMSSGGPAADSAGNIYAVTGNGPWDAQSAWADSVLKFNPQLQIVDYFTPQDYAFMNCDDADLSAGGLLLIPGTTQALAGGKTGKMYLVNTANLGHEQANDAGATQTLFFESDKVGPYSATCNDPSGAHTTQINSYEIFSTAAYYNQSVYLGVTPTSTTVPSGVRQFTYSGGTLTPSQQTTANIEESGYGTTPFISASSETTNGVLWMIDHGIPLQSGTPTGAILRAYDANDLSNELYDSTMNASDAPGYGIKFTSPIVANGKVYLSTGHDLVTTANPQGEIDVYGLK